MPSSDSRNGSLSFLAETHGDLHLGAPDHSIPFWLQLRRFWKQQLVPRLEDEMLDRSGGRTPARMVAPVLAPLLAVPAILLVREPDNMLATVCVALGAAALVYTLVADAVAQLRRPAVLGAARQLGRLHRADQRAALRVPHARPPAASTCTG